MVHHPLLAMSRAYCAHIVHIIAVIPPPLHAIATIVVGLVHTHTGYVDRYENKDGMWDVCPYFFYRMAVRPYGPESLFRRRIEASARG